MKVRARLERARGAAPFIVPGRAPTHTYCHPIARPRPRSPGATARHTYRDAELYAEPRDDARALVRCCSGRGFTTPSSIPTARSSRELMNSVSESGGFHSLKVRPSASSGVRCNQRLIAICARVEARNYDGSRVSSHRAGRRFESRSISARTAFSPLSNVVPLNVSFFSNDLMIHVPFPASPNSKTQ